MLYWFELLSKFYFTHVLPYLRASDAGLAIFLLPIYILKFPFYLSGNVGGFGGILLGFSLVAIVELVYYLHVRFFIILRENYARYY